ncbi:17025_t:CDS:2, partial [Racocetra fulgida]
GYLNNQEATNKCIDKDGWFRTGDVATVDKDVKFKFNQQLKYYKICFIGYFYVIDRVKELIKYKGHQVAPAELESLLLTHPAIADAAVIGIYSEKEATELPCAYVVPQGQGPTIKLEQEILQFVASKANNSQKLRGGVVFVDKIPKSLSGKILRRMLRAGIGFKMLTLEKARL